MKPYRLCIIKPNKSAFSETFIQQHIDRLAGDKRVIYGGAFPVYDHQDQFLIRSKIDLLSFLFQKRVLGRERISVREQALLHYFKREQIEVVFAEYGFTGAMLAPVCKAANIPLVIHFHGADAHHIPTVNKYHTLYQQAFDYASAVVVVSLDMKAALIAMGAPAAKISWVPCGVDLDKFQQVKPAASKNFLNVGRFVAKKSPEVLVKAFKQVVEQCDDARLTMVGTGPLLAPTKQLIAQLNLDGHIRLTGVLKQQEILELMGQSRCYVQHSVTAPDGDMEGTPLTILEAAAVGLPIVSTRHAGIKQAVLDKESGYLVDEYDVDAMAECMLKMAFASTDDLQAMGDAGRVHIEKNYAISQQIAKLDHLIQQSLKH